MSVIRDTVGTFSEILTGDRDIVPRNLKVLPKVLPFAVVFYLEPDDYQQLNPGSAGVFLVTDCGAPELRGRIVVVSRDESTKREKSVREHELRHVLFHQFFRRKIRDAAQKQSLTQSVFRFLFLRTFWSIAS